MSVQKKIRDLERLLAKKGSSDPAFAEGIKAKISSLQQERVVNLTKEKERKNAIKYHMVKFFERKKLARKIRSLDTKLKDCESKSDKKKLNKKRDALLEDLAYVMYYPKALKYVALFGRRGGATAAEEENEGSEPSPLQIKARELALAAWRADVEAIGELNKVAQAIKVEYEHPLKNAIIKSALEKNSNKNESKSKGSSRNRESGRQDVQEEASSESDSEDDDNDSAGPVPGLDAEASDSEVEEGPSVNAVPAKMLQNKSFGNETKNESSKKRKRDQESKPGDVAPTYEPDAFFVEEATEANDDAVFPQPVRNNHVGRGRGGSYNQGYFTPSLTKDSRSKAVSSAEVSGLSKQEARLRMWQQGKRGGHRGPGRAGLSRAASGAQGPDDVREQQGHHRTVDSGSSFRGRGGSSGRGGRGRSRVGDGAGRGGNQEAGPASRGDSRAYPRYLTPPSTNYSAPKKVQLDAAPNNKKIKFTE